MVTSARDLNNPRRLILGETTSVNQGSERFLLALKLTRHVLVGLRLSRPAALSCP